MNKIACCTSVAVCLLLLLGFSGNLVDSRIGRALRAIHGSEAAAQAVGIDTTRLKLCLNPAAARHRRD